MAMSAMVLIADDEGSRRQLIVNNFQRALGAPAHVFD